MDRIDCGQVLEKEEYESALLRFVDASASWR
jgi:hypothetical protein